MLKTIAFVILVIGLTQAAAYPSDNAPEGRIIGGRDVNIAKHPYQVSLRRKTCEICAYVHVCGGVIYNSRTILTAAHCVYMRDASSFVVVAGTNSRNGSDGAIMHVMRITINDQFNPTTNENDLALVILDERLIWNRFTIQPIAVNAEVRPKNGLKATVTGWGATSEGGQSSYQLQEVDVKVIDQDTCDSLYGFDRITDGMLCAGILEVGGKDACQYDSGGPLVSGYYLLGIVSWGNGCARPEYPGVYVNVPYYIDWIIVNSDN